LAIRRRYIKRGIYLFIRKDSLGGNMIIKGYLDVICGCMFSGKTSELIRRLERAKFANKRIQVFKSHHDVRYSISELRTHSGASVKAKAVPKSLSSELEELIDPTSEIIAIDEVQFFDEGIVTLCERLADEGKIVIVAGLDLDFRGEPFPGPTQGKLYKSPIAALMAKADHLEKLLAICTVCGKDASRSQRLVNGKPAIWDELVLVVGADDAYEARCREHHQIVKPEDTD